MSLQQVVQLLDDTLNPNQTIREKAEASLEGAKQSSFGQLLQTLAVVLSNESVTSTSREVAATYIKNALSGRSQQYKDAAAQKWEAVDPKMRETIKSQVLNTLISKDPKVCNATAQTLSKIALLELPAGRWPDLIQNLCAACGTSNAEQLRESALKSLGYICEEIDEASIADKMSSILTGIVSNMSQEVKSVSVRLTALHALESVVFFLNNLFQEKSQRDILMNIVLQNCVHQDDEVKKLALSVVSDIIHEYYPYISDYMQVIAVNITLPFIQKCTDDDDEVVKQAIEVWIAIADIETEKAMNEEDAAKDGTIVQDIDKSRRYIEGALLPLLNSLFVPLSKQDPDSDDDEWNVSHAAATCISYMSECVGSKIIAPVLQLFQTHIMSPDWHVRDAATTAFGSILQGPPPETLQPYLSDPKLLSLFLEHMRDPHIVVRSSTAWVLGRMCELHVGVVLTDEGRFEAVYQAFRQGFKDEPRVAQMCMWGLMILAQALDQFIQDCAKKVPNPLARHFSELVVELFQSGEKSGCSARQRKGAYQALNALVHCSTPECIKEVGKVTVMCLDRLEAMTAATSFPDKKDADELEALISGLLTECVSKLDTAVIEIADRVCTAYLTLCGKAAGAFAQEEAVLGLGTFAMATQRGVERYALQICQVLKGCISKPNEVDVCKAAIGALGDIARSLEEGFSKHVSEFVPLLFNLFRVNDIDRSIFSPIMSTLGDIAQFATNEMKQFIPQVITVVQQAMACKVNMNDEDDREFLFSLQEECFACIAGINSGLTTIKEKGLILTYSSGITQCIKMAYSNLDRPESLSNAIVGAICDLVIAADKQAKEVIAPGKPWGDFPSMVATILQNAQEQMTRENCKYAMERIQQALRAY